MDNSLFKKFDYYWIFVILTFILCYGFFLTNHSMGIDDELLAVYGSFDRVIQVNKIGILFFSKILFLYEYLPFFNEILGLSLYVIGLTIYSENFIKYLNFENFVFDKKISTIFTCNALSFPYLAFHFVFFDNILQHGFIMIFTAFAVRYFYKFFLQEKTKLNFILMFISLFFATSFYESAVYYFVISCLIIEFFKFVYDRNENFYKRVLAMGLFSITSITLNVLLCEVLKKIMNINYSKIDDFVFYDASSLSSFFESFVNSQGAFIQKFIATCEYNFGSVIAIISIVSLLLFSLLYSFRHKNFNIMICSIFITLVPFASLLMLGNADMSFRSYAPLSFLVALVFCLLFNQFKDKKVLANIVIGLTILVVAYNAQEQNQIYYTENLKYENDKQFAYSIMYDLTKRDLENKPIIWVGVRENPKLKYEYIESNEINTSIFNWDRYDTFESEIYIIRSYNFFKELGLEIKGYYDLNFSSKEEFTRFVKEVKNNVKGMTIYPKDGSIKDFGDYVVIKIGKTRADLD